MRRTLALWILLLFFYTLLLLSGYMLYLASTLESPSTYSIKSKYPYGLLSFSGKVVVVDYAPFYGDPFPYYMMPLQLRVQVSITGLRNCSRLHVSLAMLWSTYSIASKATYYKPPYIVVGRNAAQLYSLLEETELIGRDISGNDNTAVFYIPSSKVPETYTPRYSIIITCYSSGASRVCTGIGCGTISSILAKADKTLQDYMAKPASRRAEAEALSLIHGELAPLYRVYGYPGVSIEVTTRHSPSTSFYAYLAAPLLLLAVSLALLAKTTSSYARIGVCPYARSPILYFSRSFFAWLSIAGIIASLSAIYADVLAPLALVFSLPGLLVLGNVFEKSIPCRPLLSIGWAALRLLVFSTILIGITFMAMLLLPGPFLPALYHEEVLVFYAALALLAVPYLDAYNNGIRGGAVAAAAVLVPPVFLILGYLYSFLAMTATSLAAWYALGKKTLI